MFQPWHEDNFSELWEKESKDKNISQRCYLRSRVQFIHSDNKEWAAEKEEIYPISSPHWRPNLTIWQKGLLVDLQQAFSITSLPNYRLCSLYEGCHIRLIPCCESIFVKSHFCYIVHSNADWPKSQTAQKVLTDFQNWTQTSKVSIKTSLQRTSSV